MLLSKGRGHEMNSDNIKKVRKKTIKTFLEKGGYDIIEGNNPSGWVNPKTGEVWYRLFSELKEKTGLSKPTCMVIQHSLPTRNDAESFLGVKPKIVTIKDYTEGVWISNKDLEFLKEAYSKVGEAERLVKRIQEFTERCILIDTMAYRMQQTFVKPDLKFDEFLKGQLELSEKRENTLKNQLNDLGIEMHKLWLDLRLLSNSVKKRNIF